MYKLFLSIFFTISLSLLALESNEIKEVLPIHNENIGTEEETLVEEIVSIEEDKTLLQKPKNDYNSEELKATNVISTNKDLKENKKEEYTNDNKSEEISERTSRVTALGSAMGAVDLGKIEERKFRAGVGSSNNNQAVAVGVGYAPTDRFRVNTKFSTSSTSKRASAISIGASVDLDW